MIRKLLTPVFALVLLTACAPNDDASAFPWWGWLIVIILLVLIIWLLFRSQPETELKTPPLESDKLDDAAKITPQADEKLLPDDLTLIEGIGPKINDILHAAGVNTFSELAALDAEKIKEIITAQGIRLADTTSWPQQAKLAADGEMEELKALQDALKGGRVV